MWETVVSHFNSYVGWGIIFILYLAAVIFLFVTEKRKERRILFIYMPLVLLILFFLPPVAKLIEKLADDEIYYRLLWILPVTVTLADTMTEIAIKFKGKMRVIVIAAFAVMIMLGGRLIYTDDRFSVAENEYHMPQEVVDICDAVIIPGREVRVAFPSEFLVYVRQYTPLIVMPYGWDDIKYWGEEGSEHKMREIMNGDVIDANALTYEGRENVVHYIVVSEEKKIVGNMNDGGYEEFARIDGYVIYKSTELDFFIPSELGFEVEELD